MDAWVLMWVNRKAGRLVGMKGGACLKARLVGRYDMLGARQAGRQVGRQAGR